MRVELFPFQKLAVTNLRTQAAAALGEYARQRRFHHVAAIIRRARTCGQQHGSYNYLRNFSHRFSLITDESRPWPIQDRPRGP